MQRNTKAMFAYIETLLGGPLTAVERANIIDALEDTSVPFLVSQKKEAPKDEWTLEPKT